LGGGGGGGVLGLKRVNWVEADVTFVLFFVQPECQGRVWVWRVFPRLDKPRWYDQGRKNAIACGPYPIV